ncbi:hypothetical protein [Azospirillum sp.]|uniref:hypothetical protein n=1 Tax=Azospirillum sp. TaxID=34012 RepID=UPI002D53AB69|nr:hypothetical protein [Azospirillum sp.]HYD64015.1 hypothetical protein [Azospirillum sp.]
MTTEPSADLPIDALAHLTAERPDLLAAVNAAATPDAAADILADAAQARGIAVDRPRLAALMAANAARRGGALTDSELDQASGGGSPIPRGMEIGTAVIPVVRDRSNGDGFTPYW